MAQGLARHLHVGPVLVVTLMGSLHGSNCVYTTVTGFKPQVMVEVLCCGEIQGFMGVLEYGAGCDGSGLLVFTVFSAWSVVVLPN